MTPSISVLILNYKQAYYIHACLRSLSKQSYGNLEILFIDNASGDGAPECVRSGYPSVRVIENPANYYFSKAHNIGIHETQGEYVLLLNVDMTLREDFVEKMVAAMETDPRVGMVSGKLLRMDEQLRPYDPPVLDSTGLWFSPELRHFDRGAEEFDRSQYERMQYIFGPSGAAPLYRRKMLEDIVFQGEYFDEDFVIYREDAELAWRAQMLGWKCIYTPDAVGYHVRGLRPSTRRKQIPAELNRHSVKNRFLMRMKNLSTRNALRFFWPIFWRDIQVAAYTLLVERSSLAAFPQAIRLYGRMMEKRRQVMAKRKTSDDEMARWFAYQPTAFDLEEQRAV